MGRAWCEPGGGRRPLRAAAHSLLFGNNSQPDSTQLARVLSREVVFSEAFRKDAVLVRYHDPTCAN